MGLTTTILSAGTVAAPIYTAHEQKKALKKSEKEQKHANRIEKAKAEITRGLERKRALANARQGTALNIAGASAQGISEGSSALQGANAAIQSNLGTSVANANRSFVTQQQTFDLRQSAMNREANAAANAAIAQSISSASTRVASFAAGGA